MQGKRDCPNFRVFADVRRVHRAHAVEPPVYKVRHLRPVLQHHGVAQEDGGVLALELIPVPKREIQRMPGRVRNPRELRHHDGSRRRNILFNFVVPIWEINRRGHRHGRARRLRIVADARERGRDGGRGGGLSVVIRAEKGDGEPTAFEDGYPNLAAPVVREDGEAAIVGFGGQVVEERIAHAVHVSRGVFRRVHVAETGERGNEGDAGVLLFRRVTAVEVPTFIGDEVIGEGRVLHAVHRYEGAEGVLAGVQDDGGEKAGVVGDDEGGLRARLLHENGGRNVRPLLVEKDVRERHGLAVAVQEEEFWVVRPNLHLRSPRFRRRSARRSRAGVPRFPPR